MLFAADYPFLDVFWTMVLFFFWVAWISILFTIVGDLFRRHDASGWKKALWMIVLVFLPFLGTFIYLIANSEGMAERKLEQVQARQAQFDQHVQAAASSGGSAEEIRKAKALLDSAAITPAEFDSLKAKALA